MLPCATSSACMYATADNSCASSAGSASSTSALRRPLSTQIRRRAAHDAPARQRRVDVERRKRRQNGARHRRALSLVAAETRDDRNARARTRARPVQRTNEACRSFVSSSSSRRSAVSRIVFSATFSPVDVGQRRSTATDGAPVSRSTARCTPDDLRAPRCARTGDDRQSRASVTTAHDGVETFSRTSNRLTRSTTKPATVGGAGRAHS